MAVVLNSLLNPTTMLPKKIIANKSKNIKKEKPLSISVIVNTKAKIKVSKENKVMITLHNVFDIGFTLIGVLFFIVGLEAKAFGFSGENLLPHERQLASILLLPIVPASNPKPPVNTAPTTAFFPLNPFLSKYNCVDWHFGQCTVFGSIFFYKCNCNILNQIVI